MSNLSAKYDPQESSPHTSSLTVDDPHTATMYVKAGMMPINLLKLLGKSESFRDAFVGHMTSSSIPDDNVLNVLATTLRTTPDQNTPEFRGLCEITASIAYAWDKTELTKDALLRVSPTFASRYLQSVYTALIERGMPATSFKTMLANMLPNAETNWNVEKPALIP
jgi:hypothetical protein